MKHTKLFAALLAAALSAGSCMTALADVTASESDRLGIGPGFEQSAESQPGAGPSGPGTEQGTDSGDGQAVIPAWTKVNGAYIDDTGAPIEGAILRGVSVSKWQGDIDWTKVAADDVTFALIRMASIGYEGEYTMDEFFDKNMREARNNGIHTAPYVYLQTKTVEEARAAARFAVEQAGKYDITYPIAVDIESQYILELSVQELTDVVNAFCQVIGDAGYTPIVYSDYNKFTTEMDTNQIPYDIWLARYGGSNSYPNRTMWQSTDKGVVNGISGNVCLEFAFKDYAGTLNTADNGLTPGQWQEENGTWYFVNNGRRWSGWIKPDGNWYYLEPSKGGAMVSNTTMEIDGVTYTFDGSGVMQ